MRKVLAIGLVAAVLLAGIATARRHDLLRFAIGAAAGAAGYSIAIAEQRVGFDAMELRGVHVSRGGFPLLDAVRIGVRYSLRDLLPGSRHRFGVSAIEIDGAKLTIVRAADGTYNFLGPPPPKHIPQAQLPIEVDRVPIRFTLVMHGAAVALEEPEAYDPSAKHVGIHSFDVDASIDTGAVSRYRARGAFAGTRRDDPFTIDGTMDAIRGYAMHRARAPRFPLRALANYFADSPVIRVLKGRARNFDARLYALDVLPNVAPDYHANLQLDIDGGRLGLSLLAAPIDDVRGHLQLVDDTFFLHRIDATLAGVPLRITGGIYDFGGGLTGSPQLRLGISGEGDLARLRNAFTFTRAQPMNGPLQLGVLVAGPIGDPVIVANVAAKHVVYRNVPFDGLRADVEYHHNVVGLAPLTAAYGSTKLSVHGTLAIGKPLTSELALHIAGPASGLPFLNRLMGSEPVRLDAVAHGIDTNFVVRGAASSARGIGPMAAMFEMGPQGTATVSPFWLHAGSGSLTGGYVLDRPNDSSAYWALANGLTLHAIATQFPGLTLPVIPAMDGKLKAASIVGGSTGRQAVLAGTVESGALRIASVPFAFARASFDGSPSAARLTGIRANGPWGTFSGNGQMSSKAFVASGDYNGTFEGLHQFIGSDLRARGAIVGGASIAVEGNRILVQGRGLQLRGASIRGIPVSSADITLAVAGPRLQVYSARARAAGGDVVAAGSFGLVAGAGSGGLALDVRNLDAAGLRGLGLPFQAGRVTASGRLSAGAVLPEFHGGVAIAGGRMQQYAVSGNGDVALAGNAVRLQRVIGSLGTTYARVDGSIGSLTRGSPAYSLNANIPAGDVATTLRALGYPTYMTRGTFNAQLRIGGGGSTPNVAGHVQAPAGDVNGLPFVDANAQLSADASGVRARDGSVLVGSTAARFDAATAKRYTAISVDAPRATLSDFNNFFDAGDMFHGRGSIGLSAEIDGPRVRSRGRVAIHGLAWRDLPIGDTSANWTSARDSVTGALSIGGSEGRLRAAGSLALHPASDIRSTIAGSRYDLSATLSDADLSLWTAAFGFAQLPVRGRADASMRLDGRYPNIDVRAKADVRDGGVGPLALDTATAVVHAQRGRFVIDTAQIATRGLQANASGSFGLRPNDAVDVSVHAATSQLPALISQLTGATVPITGSFESTLQVGGTFRSPSFVAGIDATDVDAYGIAIASFFGEVRLHGRSLVLSNAGATISGGELTLAGSLPLQLSPFRIGPDDQPVNFDIDAVGMNPAAFDGLLGNNTRLSGSIDGHLGLSGTVARPIVVGQATLRNGSYVSDVERTPITEAVGRLTFNRTSASIDRVAARFGAGTVAASGRVAFPHGFQAQNGFSFVVKTVAKNAQLDLPSYGTGSVNADLALTKTPSSPALLSGNLTLADASLPFAAFIRAAQGGGDASGAPSGFHLPPLAFDVNAEAGRNVRVRGAGYGAGLDIGVAGSVRLAGTTATPQLVGTIASTGGTLTYFDRAFRVREGSVSFTQGGGLVPDIHAVAFTSVVNPDPDRARNPYGSAEITIAVDGPIDGLKIDFSTNPPGYTRDQIISMIAPFGGFINGIAFNAQSPYQVESPGGITPLGAVSPLPAGAYQTRNGVITVGQEAFNILNAQFAAGLLAPLEGALGQGLGLSSVDLNLGYYGNVGITATRLLGKSVSAVYATTFGTPQIQSFGIKMQPGPYTSATLNFFYQTGPTKLFQEPVTVLGPSNQLLLSQPLLGTSGFNVSVQRYLW
ncbi:MAG TPA: translocation/assembly module TamB domain-containing protein [Candidatus Tumulicola sp.]